MKLHRRVGVRLFVEQLESRLALSAFTTSTNWSGYAVETDLNAPQAGAVSAVRGSWTVPAVSGHGLAFASIWVGIDGFDSNTVEQIGTDSDIFNGVPVYYVWYEMYPSNSVTVSALKIKPGDSISAQVSYASTHFSLQIANNTTGQGFSIQKTAAGAERSSAEWIVEAPSSGSGILPLANFGKATFTQAEATVNGKTGAIDDPSWQNAAINMVSHGRTEATTSALTDSGGTSSFTVTFVASTSTPTRHRRGFFHEPNLPAVPPTANFLPAVDVVVRTNGTTLLSPVASQTAFTATVVDASSVHGAAYAPRALTSFAVPISERGEEGDGSDAAASPFAPNRDGTVNQIPMRPTAPQQPAPIQPQETSPPTDESSMLSDEAIPAAILLADQVQTQENGERIAVGAWSPARMAALAGVLLFLANPWLAPHEQRERRQLVA